MAGLLFGLDIAYVNGSLHLIVKEFHITSVFDEGKVAGFLLGGVAVGAFLSGGLSRKFGRKRVLILAALIFTVFTLAGVVAPSWGFLLVTRFIVGLAVGIASLEEIEMNLREGKKLRDIGKARTS